MLLFSKTVNINIVRKGIINRYKMFKDITKYFYSKSSDQDDADNDNQSADVYKSKYSDMPLEEKRKFYKCGDSYVVLEEIPIWPALYKVNEQRIKKAIQRQQQAANQKSSVFRFSEDDNVNLKVSLWQGDITKLEIGAIVNAAKETLLGGGGVDGSIHRAAGPTLVKECRLLDGCSTGEAKLTSGHKLPAKYVIHTVGPRDKNLSKLMDCYENCLRIVLEKDIKSVAFCCISTGAFGYPNRDAAHVALLTTRRWLEKHGEKVERVIFCTYLADDFQIYQELMADKYFPCTSNETKEAAEDDSGIKKSEQKVPVETDESEVGEVRTTPETDHIPAKTNVETDDLSHDNSNGLENKKKGSESDDHTVVDKDEKDGISNASAPEPAIENIGSIESGSQDAIELGSQQPEQDAMDLGSQQM